jgi:hypothetical protein
VGGALRKRGFTVDNGIVTGVPAAAVETTVTELADSRVRLHVQVPPAELDSHVERKARQLGR